MKAKTIHYCSLIVKAAGVLTGAAAYVSLLPPQWGAAAVLIFGLASIGKDAAIATGDLLDDGKRNGSFKAD